MKIRKVFITRVISKNFITDFVQQMRNIVGGRMKSYEKMLDDEIKDAFNELYKVYPTVFNTNFRLQEFTAGAMAIMVYGDIDEDS